MLCQLNTIMYNIILLHYECVPAFSNIDFSRQVRSGLVITRPGPMMLKVPSMCIALVSPKSRVWTRYSSPRCRFSHSIPIWLVTYSEENAHFHRAIVNRRDTFIPFIANCNFQLPLCHIIFVIYLCKIATWLPCVYIQLNCHLSTTYLYWYTVYMHTLTWLLWTKMSLPARMKSATSKQGSNSVVTNFPIRASLVRSSVLPV